MSVEIGLDLNGFIDNKTLRTLNSEELVSAAQNGSKESFEQLMRITMDSMLAIAYSYTKNKAKSEDIVQDSFIKAFKNIRSFRKEANFKSWMARIVINSAKNSLRAKKDQDHENLDDHSFESGNEFMEMEEQNELNSHIERLKRGIELLPERQRQVIELKIYGEKELKEIALNLNSPYDTVKANYRHGLLKLKNFFEKDLKTKNMKLATNN